MKREQLQRELEHQTKFWGLVHLHHKTKGKVRLAKKAVEGKPLMAMELNKLKGWL